MSHPLVEEAKSKMDKSVVAFRQEMGNIRTARATTGLLDVVDVDVYGQKMKINQVGTVSVPDAHLIVIDLWDKSQMAVVEKAIIASPLGIMPSNDGRVIRVPIPALNEARRKELVKVASKHVEEAKIAIRAIRRHAIDEIKKLQKDGTIPEDEGHRHSEEVQKLTDMHTDQIDAAFKAKEADIMEV
ncbi:MAG: ribosome recycling factor [Candidatus Hydrogenedentes bacterium]|nr:ribosome recycling factor [Candidatus Hydrogenedentota bacterium]